MKKKFVSFILAMAMIICCFPISVFAGDGDATITVGSIVLSAAKASDSNLPGAEYNAAANTLTLAAFNNQDARFVYNAVESTKPLTVVVQENSTIGGIDVNGNLIISGSGILNIISDANAINVTVSNKKVTISAITINITADNYGIYFNGTNELTLNGTAKITASAYVGIYCNNDMSMLMSDTAELNITAQYRGVYVYHDLKSFRMKDSSRINITSNDEAFKVWYSANSFNMEDNSRMNLVSLQSDGLYIDDMAKLTVTDSAIIDINARNRAFYCDYSSYVNINGNASVSAIGTIGLYADNSNCSVHVLGGALDITAYSFAMDGGYLTIQTGSSVKMIGYARVFNDLDGFTVEGVDTNWRDCDLSYFYPSNLNEDFAKVGDTPYNNLSEAYKDAMASGKEIKIVTAPAIPVTLKITSPGTVTIDALGNNIDLSLVYNVAGAKAILKDAANANCAVRIAEEYIDGYYNGEALISGISRGGLAIDGYTLYQTEAPDEYTIIKTLDAPFAVAAASSGGLVTEFKFFKSIHDAIDASSTAAIKDTVYVLNYCNFSTEIKNDRYHIEEETVNNPINIGSITFRTLSRITNGVYSSFYLGVADNAVLQYSNGPMTIGSVDNCHGAYLIGHFNGSRALNDVYLINSDSHPQGLLLWYYGYDVSEPLELYISTGSPVPSFTPFTREGYEIDGYYPDEHSKTLKVLNADGKPVSTPLIYDDKEIFDAEGNFVYDGYIELCAHWTRVEAPAKTSNASVTIGGIGLNSEHTTDAALSGIEFIAKDNTLNITGNVVGGSGEPLAIEVAGGYSLNIFTTTDVSFASIKINGPLNIKGSGTLNLINVSKPGIEFGMDNAVLTIEDGAKLNIKTSSYGIFTEDNLALLVRGNLTIDSEDEGVYAFLNLKMGVKGNGNADITSRNDYAVFQDSGEGIFELNLEGSAVLDLTGLDGIDADGCNEINIKDNSKLIINASNYGIYLCEDSVINLTENASLTISNPIEYGICFEDEGRLNIRDNANLKIRTQNQGIYFDLDGIINMQGDNALLDIESDGDAIYGYYDLDINLAGKSKLNLVSKEEGVYCDDDFSLVMTDDAEFTINAKEDALWLDENAYILLKDNVNLSANSLEEDGIYADCALNFIATDSAIVNVIAPIYGIACAEDNDYPNIQILGSSRLNIDSFTGIGLGSGDCVANISGGTTRITGQYGMVGGTLNINGGDVHIVGYNAALWNMTEYNKDGTTVNDWIDLYCHEGAVLIYPVSNATGVAEVDGKSFDNLQEAYEQAVISDAAIEIKKGIDYPICITLTSDKAVTIAALNCTLSSLILVYECEDTCVNFTDAEKVSCTVKINQNCGDYYNVHDEPPVLIKGLSADQVSLNLSGYTMYQEGAEKELFIIETISAPFAIAETSNGAVITKFKFFRTLDEALTASSESAVKDTVYVLNYINGADSLYYSQTDLSEETSGNAISVADKTLSTVTRVTNGIGSAFFIAKDGQAVLQYTNTEGLDSIFANNLTATLIGNFTGNHTEDNIVVVTDKNNLNILRIKASATDINDAVFYMTSGAFVPDFKLASKTGYELLGYYTETTDDVTVKYEKGQKILSKELNGAQILDSKAKPVIGASIGGINVFTAQGAWAYNNDLEIVAQFAKIYEEEPENPVIPSGGRSVVSPKKATDAAVYASLAAVRFSDVKEDDYFAAAVGWALENKITEGITKDEFGPYSVCNRAQMVTFLWRVAGCPQPKTTNCQFTDIEAASYYYKAVLWAVENGITQGTSETTFEPSKSVGRNQAVTFLWRYAEKPVVNYFMQMTDVADDQYYTEAVRWALSEKITLGTSDTTFSPDDDCLRGQIVTFLYRNFVK